MAIEGGKGGMVRDIARDHLCLLGVERESHSFKFCLHTLQELLRLRSSIREETIQTNVISVVDVSQCCCWVAA